mgnify:CR=1 FL=1
MEGLEFKSINQLLVYADDMALLGDTNIQYGRSIKHR